MAQFDPTDKKLTSGFVVGGETIYIEAAKISTDTYGVAESWPATIDSTNSGFVPTISAVKSEIDNKIAGVYQIKGTETLDNMLETDFTGKSNGYVYNVNLGTEEGHATKVPAAQSYNGEEFPVNKGDNLVWVKDAGESGNEGWDKLATSLDMSDVATTAWVNSTATTGSLPAQWIANAYTTSGAMTGTGSAASALVSNAGIQDYVKGYVDDNTIKTSTELSGITAEGSTDGDKLVAASAITGYVYDQIQTTIQETIDIAETLTSGMDATTTPPASAVPNAGAVTGYIDTNTIKTSADMIADTANANGLVSNDAIKSYVSAQLAGTNAYGGIIVNSMSASAAKPGDTFKMIDGAGVAIVSADDADGNPTIKFNHNISISGTAGTATDAAELTVTPTTAADEKAVNFAIQVPDATSAKAGVVKADYYEESTGLIHLF